MAPTRRLAAAVLRFRNQPKSLLDPPVPIRKSARALHRRRFASKSCPDRGKCTSLRLRAWQVPVFRPRATARFALLAIRLRPDSTEGLRSVIDRVPCQLRERKRSVRGREGKPANALHFLARANHAKPQSPRRPSKLRAFLPQPPLLPSHFHSPTALALSCCARTPSQPCRSHSVCS